MALLSRCKLLPCCPFYCSILTAQNHASDITAVMEVSAGLIKSKKKNAKHDIIDRVSVPFMTRQGSCSLHQTLPPFTILPLLHIRSLRQLEQRAKLPMERLLIRRRQLRPPDPTLYQPIPILCCKTPRQTPQQYQHYRIQIRLLP